MQPFFSSRAPAEAPPLQSQPPSEHAGAAWDAKAPKTRSLDDHRQQSPQQSKGGSDSRWQMLQSTYPRERRSDLAQSKYRAWLQSLDNSKVRHLDPDYKVRENPDRFFSFGKVFYALWSEPAGSGKNAADHRKDMYPTPFGERIHVKVRRFVVVRNGTRSCVCLSISTHAGRGISQAGLNPREHAVVYTGRDVPPLLPHELSPSGETPALLPPIRVDPDAPSERLDPTSRIDFGKVYTIRHDVKVKPLGVVNRISTAVLEENYLRTMSLQSSVGARPNGIRPSISAIAPTPSDPRGSLKADVLADLAFDGMGSRYETIKPAVAGTCGWIFDRPEYSEWLNATSDSSEDGFLWIKGKPGCGKSTLMKEIVSRHGRDQDSATVASFFFNRHGATLQHSTEGMYRSFLYQVLQQASNVPLRWLETLPETMKRKRPVIRLMDLFDETVAFLKPKQRLVCIIDGLDEGELPDMRDVVDHLKRLRKWSADQDRQVLICLSSRHYPRISRYQHREICLDKLEEHMQDIHLYLRSNLDFCSETAKSRLHASLVEKSSGTFTWVVLVISELRRAYDSGERESALFDVLNTMPQGLENLWRDILSSESGTTSQELSTILRWVSISERPLTLQELFFAVQANLGRLQTNYREIEEFDIDFMKLRITQDSRGLVEYDISERGEQYVRFVHESLRTYLMQRGLMILDLKHENDPVAASHLRIAQDCLACLSFEMPSKVMDRTFTTLGSPLMEYALKFGLGHLEYAFQGGSPDFFLLQSLSFKVLAVLLCLNPAILINEGHSASVLYLLVVTRHFALARALISCTFKPLPENLHDGESAIQTPDWLQQPDLNSFCGGCFGSPLHAAAALGDSNLVRHLLLSGADVNLRGWYQTLLNYPSPLEAAIAWNSLGMIKLKPNWTIATGLPVSHGIFLGGTTLYNGHHLQYGHKQDSLDLLQMVQLLLDWGADVNQSGQFMALHTACQYHNVEVVHLLLKSGASPNARDDAGMTALHILCDGKRYAFGFDEADAMSVLDLLVRHGADLSCVDSEGRTALFLACHGASLDVVEVLCARGADVSQSDSKGNSPLMAACSGDSPKVGHFVPDYSAKNRATNPGGKIAPRPKDWRETAQIVTLLLRRGADLNARNRAGLNSLMIASFASGLEVVRLLRDWDADQNARDRKGRDSLMLACSVRRPETIDIAKELLDHGHDINATNIKGQTALFHAMRAGNLEVVKLLLRSGADTVRAGDNRAITLDIALSHMRHWQIAQLLADLQTQTPKGLIGFAGLQDSKHIAETTHPHVSDEAISFASDESRPTTCTDQDQPSECTTESTELPDSKRHITSLPHRQGADETPNEYTSGIDSVSKRTSISPSPSDRNAVTGGHAIQVMSDAQQHASVDLIFVHGLNESHQSPWLENGKSWPGPLETPEPFQDARVMVYEYDARPGSFWGTASRARLTYNAWKLLTQLNRQRFDTGTPARPIVWIAHSLGGLVVQKALAISNTHEEQDLRNIARYTMGLIALGTPIAGSDMTRWAGCCKRLDQMLYGGHGMRKTLEFIKGGAEVLMETSLLFGQLLESRRYTNTPIRVKLFQETLPTAGIGIVIPKECARLFDYPIEPMQTNHEDMAKFFSRKDDFENIANTIQSWVGEFKSD